MSEQNGAPLFETKTELTDNECKRYNQYISGRQPPSIIVAFVGLACLVLGLFFVRYFGYALIVLGAVLMLGVLILPRINGSRYYKSNKFTRDMEIDVRFYSDHLECHGDSGQTLLQYGNVHKIYETKTNFYIMISPAKGIILVKDNCSPGLTELVRKLKAGEKVG